MIFFEMNQDKVIHNSDMSSKSTKYIVIKTMYAVIRKLLTKSQKPPDLSFYFSRVPLPPLRKQICKLLIGLSPNLTHINAYTTELF